MIRLQTEILPRNEESRSCPASHSEAENREQDDKVKYRGNGSGQRRAAVLKAPYR